MAHWWSLYYWCGPSHGKFKQDEPMPDLVKKAAEVTSIGVQAGEGRLAAGQQKRRLPLFRHLVADGL